MMTKDQQREAEALEEEVEGEELADKLDMEIELPKFKDLMEKETNMLITLFQKEEKRLPELENMEDMTELMVLEKLEEKENQTESFKKMMSPLTMLRQKKSQKLNKLNKKFNMR